MDATATSSGGAEVEQVRERGGLALAVLGRRSAEEGAGRLWWTRARGEGFTARQQRAAAAATTTISLSLSLSLRSFLSWTWTIPIHSMDDG